MVISRSDTKRRRKEDVAPVEIAQEESPKRAKVHAQRKFAQGSASLNSSPAHTPVKDVTKASDVVVPAKFIPSNRPKTEDFLTFLCFRGTTTLPARLDFFNVASVQENLGNEQDVLLGCADPTRDSGRVNRGGTSATPGGNRRPRASDKSRAGQPVPSNSNTKKTVTTNASTKKKSDLAVQALVKKYQEQRLAKSRANALSKLALKVKGKNMVRTRSSANQEEILPEVASTITHKKHTKKKYVDHSKILPKTFSRLMSTAKNKRGGLRSGGQLAPGSSAGLKTDRSPRRSQHPLLSKQGRNKSTGKPFISSLSDFSSDDDQPLLKKTRLNEKIVAQRGRSLAQKVKNRYTKQRPNNKLRPQIITRSQQQLNAMKEAREKERKENLIKERELKKLKDIDVKEKSPTDPKASRKQEVVKKNREQKVKGKVDMIEKGLKPRNVKEKMTKDQKEIEKHEMIVKEVKEKEREMREKELKSEKELRDKERKFKTGKEIAAPLVESGLSSRPSRKTKEAAAFYMEMLGKRLIDLGDDDDDDFLSLDSFPELPNARRSEQREKEIKARAKENNLPFKNKSKSVPSMKSKPDSKDGDKISNIKMNEKNVLPLNLARPTTILPALSKSEEHILPVKPVETDVESEKETTSPLSRRRSLRTGSFHVPGDFSESKPKSKSSATATSKTANSIMSESFSDSDEEPLGKLALRSKRVSVSSLEAVLVTKARKSREVPTGGMKEALRESITHPPPMPKKVNEKLGSKVNVKGLEKDIQEKSQAQQVLKKFDDISLETVDAELAGNEARKVDLNSKLKPSAGLQTCDIKAALPENMTNHVKIEKLVQLNNLATNILSEGMQYKYPNIVEIISEQRSNNSSTPRLEVRLQKLDEQRSTKNKVNMSTEQIEKWLNESCNRDVQQPTFNSSEPDPLISVESTKSLSSETIYKEKCLPIISVKSAPLVEPKPKLKNKSQRIPAPMESKPVRVRREIRAPSLGVGSVSAFQQSLNRAIAESIKDNANFLRRKNAEKVDAISTSKDVSPISNLSISTVSLSDLGGSETCGLRPGQSTEELRNMHYPERTPEKKSIFQRSRHSYLKTKLRKDLKPSVNAFSPENERSVYAFDSEPELPPTSQPFRRQTTRDSRASSIATSRSEDDLSKLVDDDISPLTLNPRLPQTLAKPSKTYSKSSTNNFISKEISDGSVEDRILYPQLPTQTEDCLPPLTMNVEPTHETVDFNTSNTTSNSDEDLARVRERLLSCQPPTTLAINLSTSIAVQVNLDSDDETTPVNDASFFNQSLECSTQTEVDEDEDDDNGHLFYIPLQPGAAGSHRTASGMIQGVAVKLGTEGPTGPNQRVIMRAKLVTKPPKFNKAANTRIEDNGNRPPLSQPLRRPINALLPDQKLASGASLGAKGVYPPIGTVQPTSRAAATSTTYNAQNNLPQLNTGHMETLTVQRVEQSAPSLHVAHKNSSVQQNSIQNVYISTDGQLKELPISPQKPACALTNHKVPSTTVNSLTEMNSKTVYYSYHQSSRKKLNELPSGIQKPVSSMTDPKVPSTTVNSTEPTPKTVYYSYHQSSRKMYLNPTVKQSSGALPSKPPTLHRIGQDGASSSGSSGAAPGSVNWALPQSINASRKKSHLEQYYSTTSDKVVVAKKKAFISAVPPLAPLSYKKITTVILAPPVAKLLPVTVPSQVPSTNSVTPTQTNLAATTTPVVEAPLPVEENVSAIKDTEDSTVQIIPATSESSSKSGNGLKRGPKFGWKKANLERALETCHLISKNKFPKPGSHGQMVEAPVFHPTESEFQDPIEYIERIRPIAEKFGLCRIVPPSNFKPECKVSDDMRFSAYNQYVHKTLHRWGPNVKEMMAIRKYLATQNIILKQPPYIGSIEIDLPRLYQTVQGLGGLKEVILKARWHKVADEMKISKSAQDRASKLDDIYCKYLLPYETLSAAERALLLESVEMSWQERERKKSKNSTQICDAVDDDDSSDESDDSDECIVKGRTMPLNQFYRTARNTMNMWFKQPEPLASTVETEFWKHVTTRQSHVCVLSGSIESSRWGYGFPVSKNSPCAKHAWNLKVMTNNSGSVLRSIGPIMGVTVPTLHVGMLFTACCWYRDPHGLPWIEYLHTGASKIWYGIPDEFSSLFRTALTKLVPSYVKDKTIWLPSDTAMVPPPLLAEQGVSLSRTVQEPGQFIVVFPRAFTSSICTGYLVSESVYYAQPRWLATAEQVFKDVHDSCEPSMFSLERLLFCISKDTRSSLSVLKQVLPMIKRICARELDFRKQLCALGLKAVDRLDLPEASSKKRKSAVVDEEGEYECEICRANLYVSLVTNSHEEGVYCLPHAVDHLTKHRHHLKYCKLQYTYNEPELESLQQKLENLIEVKSQKKSHGKL